MQAAWKHGGGKAAFVTLPCAPCLYAKLLRSSKSMFMHPLHVLLNVSIKLVIWPVPAPLYQMGILYTMSCRPADQA